MQTAILLKVREKEKITIGRGSPGCPPNKIQINSQYVSSSHCLLVPEDGSLVLTDSSRNGTWVSCTSSYDTSEPNCSSPSSCIKAIKNIHNTSAKLYSNTYIILIPPTLSKLPNEIVGLHFTGLDATKEFYHLECLKLKSLLENRQLMTFFTHLSVGGQYAAVGNNCQIKLSRKRIRPSNDENRKFNSIYPPDGEFLGTHNSSCEFDLSGDGGRNHTVWKSSSLKENSIRISPKDGECTPPSKSVRVELEQCQFCLEDFPIDELIEHSEKCNLENKGDLSCEGSDMLEQCQNCFKTFPIAELIKHSHNCKVSKDTSIEVCMKCFRDYPLSELVQHSENCKGDILRPHDTERFRDFIPSVLDLDAVSCSVLNDTQHQAVAYVVKESKITSDKIYPFLKCRVRHFGYKDADLDKTLHWIRYEAPIIIHVHLDRVMEFLANDTHYRNRFETGTSSGSLDLTARKSWENRIFNKIYHESPPADRVKYGVLNIVGDFRGVKACYAYGDSFLQLKKVRLRTTFASADTSSSNVKLSCCEHYVNVLNEYSDSELKAILDVATRRVSYHGSEVIGTYKEVQIHGPVCLSENVECIVVNERHRGDLNISKLLEKFIRDNNCNLIWMDQVS